MSQMGIYYRLPYALKVAAASARGYYLRSCRYSAETDRLVEEMLERDKWSPEQWKKWREERLSFLLHRAATRVPWYRQHWEERRRKGDNASWEVLENWPVLEKDTFRRNSRAFLADDVDPKKMIYDVTSGTTGSPTELWLSQKTDQIWYAQFEARSRRWHGLSRDDRWAHIGGKQVTEMGRRKPPFWVWNAGLNQLYLSSYHLIPGLIHHYADAMKRHKVKYLLGYSTSLFELARGIIREGVDDVKLEAVITNAEPIFPHQRKVISKAFHCPVRETYGMVELVAAASDCEHGTLHQWPDTGVIEVLERGEPVPSGTPGDFICTGLVNPDMLLIRFRVGDRGVISTDDSPCACGRRLPRLGGIEGRISDMVITMDGRQLAPANVECIYDQKHPIVEAQLIQHTVHHVTLRYVPTKDFTPAAGEHLIATVRHHIGPVQVTMEPMERIPRGPNGKMRAVISQLSVEEREAALNGMASSQPLH